MHAIDHTVAMSDDIFHLQPWRPEAAATAQNIISEIHAVTPDLEVLFMGAAALKLPGKNDIDLDILCPAKDIAHNTEQLLGVLGEPNGIAKTMTVWKFERNGFEIDCILSDPSVSHVPHQKRAFELLKENAKLRKEYEELKQNSDGLPNIEYEKCKKAFFRRIVSKHNLSE